MDWLCEVVRDGAALFGVPLRGVSSFAGALIGLLTPTADVDAGLFALEADWA